jgi:hypothetical protein
MDKLQPGDKVLYIPLHCNGDLQHPAVETGIVSETPVSANLANQFLFVRFETGANAKLTPIRLLQRSAT